MSVTTRSLRVREILYSIICMRTGANAAVCINTYNYTLEFRATCVSYRSLSYECRFAPFMHNEKPASSPDLSGDKPVPNRYVIIYF